MEWAVWNGLAVEQAMEPAVEVFVEQAVEWDIELFYTEQA